MKPPRKQFPLNRAAAAISLRFSLIVNQAHRFLPLFACILATTVCGCSLVGPLVSAAAPYAGIKMMFACIPARTSIDTPNGPRPIEQLEVGDSVIGFGGKPVRILQKHSYLEDPATVFLRIAFADGASVDLCRMHRVHGIPAGRLQIGQSIAGRKVTRIESRDGETRSFDLLTEDAGYRIQGVPVNSMIEEMAAAARRSVRH
jgi:hypothetical protein